MDLMRSFGRMFVPGIREEEEDPEPDKAAVQRNSTKEIAKQDSEERTAVEVNIMRAKPRLKPRVSPGHVGVTKSLSLSRLSMMADVTVEEETTTFQPVVARKTSSCSSRENDEESICCNGDRAPSEPTINWESAMYKVDQMSCDDEVTALAVSPSYIVLQFYLDPALVVYDNRTKERLYALEGHEYGGQCIQIMSDRILFSGSMDKTLRAWSLESTEGRLMETIYNHVDYVQSLAVLEHKWVATGGRGDHTIYVYETDDKGKLWRRHRFEGHEGWVTHLLFLDRGKKLLSGSDDATLRLWDLQRGTLLRVLPQDDAISCLKLYPSSTFADLVLFGDRTGKLSFLNIDTRATIHLLPNILIGTGRHSRSSKYHDKAVDCIYVSERGDYLITASTGSKFIKIWRVRKGQSRNGEEDLEETDVTELQILREHSEFLTTFSVHGPIIYSTCSDGRIYLHTFPNTSEAPIYEMATEQEEGAAGASVCLGVGGSLVTEPESSTAICLGPKLCRVGKVGLVRSSSSFQVKINLLPKVCAVNSKIRLPATVDEADDESDESEFESDSDTTVYETGSDSE